MELSGNDIVQICKVNSLKIILFLGGGIMTAEQEIEMIIEQLVDIVTKAISKQRKDEKNGTSQE